MRHIPVLSPDLPRHIGTLLSRAIATRCPISPIWLIFFGNSLTPSILLQFSYPPQKIGEIRQIGHAKAPQVLTRTLSQGEPASEIGQLGQVSHA